MEEGGVRLNNFFGKLDGKRGGGQFLDGGNCLVIINFTSLLSFDLLFTYRLKDVVSLVIFHSRF